MAGSKKRAPPSPEKALQLLMQSIAAQQTGDKSTDDKKPERKPRPAQYTVFRAVVQTDNPHQMDVFRWLISDSSYTVVWILHDRDRYAPEDMDSNGIQARSERNHMDADGRRALELDEYGRHVRKGWQNTQIFHVGDLKPPHIHMIIKTGRKCTGETMSGRFGQYVHFEGVSDVQQTALYLTHRTFDSRNKYQYPEFAVQGDLDYYAECACLAQDEMNLCKRWLDYCNQAKDSDADVYSTAIKIAIAAGDKALVRSVMSHGYFYKNLM